VHTSAETYTTWYPIYSKAPFHNKGWLKHRSKTGGQIQGIAEPKIVVWGVLLTTNYPCIRSNTASFITQQAISTLKASNKI
jgi:hypothetical protein